MKNGSLCIWRWVAWPFIQLLLFPDYQQQSLELGYFEITAYSDAGLLIVLSSKMLIFSHLKSNSMQNIMVIDKLFVEVLAYHFFLLQD